MSKEMAVITLGVWTLLVPYLGVPGSVRTVILVLTGIAIAIVGFLLRAEALNRTARLESRNSSYVESVPQEKTPQNFAEHGISSLN